MLLILSLRIHFPYLLDFPFSKICMYNKEWSNIIKCNNSLVYTLPAKNMEYFLFQRLFAFLWGVQGIAVLEILSYEQILLLEELIST